MPIKTERIYSLIVHIRYKRRKIDHEMDVNDFMQDYLEVDALDRCISAKH